MFFRNQQVAELGTHLINELLSVHGKSIYGPDVPTLDEINCEEVVRESFKEIKGNRDFQLL